MYVGQPLSLCQGTADMQSKSVVYVLIFVMHVPKNVKDIQIWTIVSSVHKHVEDVLKNVAGWLDNNQYKSWSASFETIFFYLLLSF
jgi:hypothetical protein